MDDRFTISIDNHTDLNWCTVLSWSHEHRHRHIVGFKGFPVMSVGVNHVIVGDTVLTGTVLDIHPAILP